MDITLYDLLDAYEFSDLHETFLSIYGETYARNAEGFEKVFTELRERENFTPTDFTIKVNEDEHGMFVSGYQREGGDRFSLSFESWSEWLSMKIHPESVLNYDGKVVLCLCLWDMTFWGFDEETIQNALPKDEIELALEELEDLEDEKKVQDFLRKYFKDEISSSSSSDFLM